MSTIVIGIAGGTASGKSTLARALADELGDQANHLVHDRYYRPVAPEQAETHNWDHPDALDTALLIEHVDQLCQGRATVVPSYDFTEHARLETGTPLEPKPFLIVEGILVMSDPELRERFDVSFFVEAPADIRLIRRIRRDRIERGRSLESILDQYEATVRPMHEQFVAPARAHASQVIDGTASLSVSLQRVLRALHQRTHTPTSGLL